MKHLLLQYPEYNTATIMLYEDAFAMKRFAIKCGVLVGFAALPWKIGAVAALAFMSGFSSIIAAGYAVYFENDLRSAKFTYWDEAGAFLFINTTFVIFMLTS